MDRRQQILEAAEALFREKGYRRVSVREIARAAGVGPSAVSYYFGSKEALHTMLFPGEAPHKEDVKLRIERAGLRLFAEDGYERVSIRDVAEAAQVNSAAISYYFGGKAGLYRQILYRGTGLISEFTEIVEREKPSPEGILHLYGTFLCRLGEERPAVLRLIFRELMAGTAVFRDFVRERLAGVMAIIHRAAADGVAAGQFRPGLRAEETCLAWAGMVLFYFLSSGIHSDISPERTLRPESYLDEAWGIFEKGVLRPETAEERSGR